MTLLDDFRLHLAALRLPPGRALVAVSGGPDSVALLDLLHASRDGHGLELVVTHFDHGIAGASAHVAAGVAALASDYGLAFESARAELGPDATETAAREARYAWLESTRLRLGAGIILTAHHADDQVETVLMRALVGSGTAGLAGMASKRGSLVRPLLPFRREQLLRYVRARALPVWDDPANHDPRHLRSWLRTEVLPGLRHRLPGVDQAMLSVAGHAARERSAWQAVLELLPGLDFRLEEGGFSVAARGLSGYDSALAITLLRAAARRVGYRLAPAHALRLFRVAGHAASGAMVPLGDGWVAEVAFDRLTVGRAEGGSVPVVSEVRGPRGEAAWGAWRMRWRVEPAPERLERTGLTTWVAPAPLQFRRWNAGERIRPLRGRGGRLLVRCFQEARIPRSRRADWPVLYGPDDLVWVPGVCRSEALLPPAGTEAMRIDAEHA
jgi:tRNA(Ile)-lysidine synthase